MDKYLVFALEKWVTVNVAKDDPDAEIVLAINRKPEYRKFKVNCYELIEFYGDVTDAEFQANAYSEENSVRTLVIKGSVFGG